MMRAQAFWTMTSLISALLMSDAAHARGGIGSAARGLKNPNSLDGLCTASNSGQTWVKQGWCKAIRETFNKHCSDKFKSLQQQLTKDGNGLRKDIEQNYCPGFGSLVNDKLKFSMFLENLSAALFIEESDWRPKATGDGGRSQGIAQISVQVAKMGPYRCGCKSTNSKSDIWDGAKNSACGASIVLHWLENESKREGEQKVGGGKAGGGKAARGIAAYFGPMGDGQKNKRSRIQKKVANWCRKNGSDPGAKGLDQDADATS